MLLLELMMGRFMVHDYDISSFNNAITSDVPALPSNVSEVYVLNFRIDLQKAITNT